MRIAVAAPRRGATWETTERLADASRAAPRGAFLPVEVTARDPARFASLTGHGVVVPGNAVYFGHWPAARTPGRTCGSESAGFPVWLFPSGRIRDRRPGENSLSAPEHRPVGRTIDRARRSFDQRTVRTARYRPEGDHRSRPTVRSWAREIARQLTATPAAPGGSS
ncbi:hypothetical protein [Amycolatopsis panacis]|nr:hypothetical protein [Amycolatopsis panacis]